MDRNQESERETHTTRSYDQANEASDEKTDGTSSDRSSSSEQDKLQKQKKDLMHRDIEKRRRDRINKSLSQLKDLIPTAKKELKIDGNNTRSGRLQKAKLLELAVEYLQNISGCEHKDKSPDYKYKPEKKDDTVIIESAKEIYMTGYKAGLNHLLMEVTQRFELTQQQMNEIIASFKVKEVRIPDMLLILPSKEEKAAKNGFHISTNNSTRMEIPADGVRDINTSSDMNEKSSKYTCEEIQKNGWNTGDTHRNAIEDALFPRSIGSNTSAALFSTYVLDPVTSRYYPTLLPLDVILSLNKNIEPKPNSPQQPKPNNYDNEVRKPLTSPTVENYEFCRKRRFSEEVPVIQHWAKRARVSDVQKYEELLRQSYRNHVYATVIAENTYHQDLSHYAQKRVNQHVRAIDHRYLKS